MQSEGLQNPEGVEEIMKRLIQKNTSEQMINQLIWQLDELCLDNYLVQLVYLYTRKWWPALQKVLLKRCAKIPSFEIIKWSFEAYTQNYRKEKVAIPEIEQFESKVEESMVNSGDCSLDGFLEKEARSNYVNSIQRCVNNLTQISLNLKMIPQVERKQYLRRNLVKGNRALESFRRNNQNIRYCQGILLPFRGNSQLVVRVIDTEAQAFNTKKRVPYRIVLETIDIEEHAPLSLSKQLSIDSQAFYEYDVMNQFDYTILENFLEESRKDQLARQQIQNQNRKRFNEQFKQEGKLDRRNSCISKIQSITNKELLEQQLKHFIMDKKKMSDRVLSQNAFFEEMLSQYPNKKQHLLKIKESLNIQEEKKIAPQTGPFSECWNDKELNIRKSSPFSQYQSYKLRSLLIKGGDDLRQEQMMMQLLQMAENSVYLRTYDIIITSADSGILEFCNDTLSLDELKKCKLNQSLKEIYLDIFGDCFEEARRNFIVSLAGYSLMQYFFQIKDRHNGNILIDNMGHLIHIDFGFILTLSPGGMGFESAPFKLTKEYIQLMDGKNSDMFTYFRQQMYAGFLALRQLLPKFTFLLDIMRFENELPCLDKFDMKVFQDRFLLQISDEDVQPFVNKLIDQSAENKRTVIYDNFQKITNNILP